MLPFTCWKMLIRPKIGKKLLEVLLELFPSSRIFKLPSQHASQSRILHKTGMNSTKFSRLCLTQRTTSLLSAKTLSSTTRLSPMKSNNLWKPGDLVTTRNSASILQRPLEILSLKKPKRTSSSIENLNNLIDLFQLKSNIKIEMKTNQKDTLSLLYFFNFHYFSEKYF
jgi:hypothetical protein